MRIPALACLVVVAGSSALTAAETDLAPVVKHTVRLSSLVLEELKKTKPDTYAEARRVMAAASELCAPGTDAAVVEVRKPAARGVPAMTCSGVPLLTSNPPKREISFIIDDTKYVALVTMTAPPPQLREAVELAQ
jgi:hypothetical protein